MNSILRTSFRLPTTKSLVPSTYSARRAFSLSPRTYGQSSYGGEGDTQSQQPNNPRNSPTRDIEHPGPAAPDVSKGSTTSKPQSSTTQEDRDEQDSEGTPTHMSPSNKAHPTITDGRQSPNLDSKGNPRSDVPKDVKKHNEEMEKRYDRPYNQIGDEGGVRKGF
ncbi:hypothetical protein BDV25DRAFT_78555 [Aspergillus avenaceus]|uniref:Uncharacterized protein n=1 Tax=Aspergillus avenaceus TaxID=36643 RepID=A0A5N6TG15_ASPAV|nr:hypothetical protein BDV25DRAFT_78555 [Aspergillus avenaceus]